MKTDILIRERGEHFIAANPNDEARAEAIEHVSHETDAIEINGSYAGYVRLIDGGHQCLELFHTIGEAEEWLEDCPKPLLPEPELEYVLNAIQSYCDEGITPAEGADEERAILHTAMSRLRGHE